MAKPQIKRKRRRRRHEQEVLSNSAVLEREKKNRELQLHEMKLKLPQRMVVLKQQRRMQKQEPRLAQQRERRVQKRVKEQRQKSAKQEDKQKRKEKWMEEVMQKYAQQREPERIQELERRELLITGARKVSKYTGRSSFLQNVEAAPELIDESVPGFVQVPGPASVPEPAQVPGPAEQNGVDHGNLDEQPSYQEKDLDPEPVDQQHSHRNDHDSNNNETSALNAVGIALRDTETRGNALAEQSVQGSSFDETPRSSPELLVLGAPETIAPVEGEITDGTSITTGGDHAIPLQATQAEIIIQESNEDRWSLDLARESEVSEIQQNTGTEASTNDSSSEEEAVQYNPEVNPLFLATDAFGVTKSVAAETFGNSSGNTHCVQTDSGTLKATHAETTVPGSSETKSSAHDVLNGMSTISAGEPEIPKAQQETGAEVPVTNLSSEKQAHLDAPKSGISASESIDPTTGKMLQEKSETADHAPVKVNGLQAGQVEPPTPVSSSSSPSVFDMFGSILMTLILTTEVSEVQQNTGTEMSLHGANTKEQQHQDTSEPTKSGAQDVLEVGFLTTDCVQPHLQDRQTTQLSDDDDFCRKLLTSNREPEITESHQNSENKSLLHRSSSGKQVYGKSSRERPVVLDTGKAAEKVEAPFGITYRIQANLLATQSADISLDIDLIFSTHEPTVPGDQKNIVTEMSLHSTSSEKQTLPLTTSTETTRQTLNVTRETADDAVSGKPMTPVQESGVPEDHQNVETEKSIHDFITEEQERLESRSVSPMLFDGSEPTELEKGEAAGEESDLQVPQTTQAEKTLQESTETNRAAENSNQEHQDDESSTMPKLSFEGYSIRQESISESFYAHLCIGLFGDHVNEEQIDAPQLSPPVVSAELGSVFKIPNAPDAAEEEPQSDPAVDDAKKAENLADVSVNTPVAQFNVQNKDQEVQHVVNDGVETAQDSVEPKIAENTAEKRNRVKVTPTVRNSDNGTRKDIAPENGTSVHATGNNSQTTVKDIVFIGNTSDDDDVVFISQSTAITQTARNSDNGTENDILHENGTNVHSTGNNSQTIDDDVIFIANTADDDDVVIISHSQVRNPPNQDQEVSNDGVEEERDSEKFKIAENNTKESNRAEVTQTVQNSDNGTKSGSLQETVNASQTTDDIIFIGNTSGDDDVIVISHSQVGTSFEPVKPRKRKSSKQAETEEESKKPCKENGTPSQSASGNPGAMNGADLFLRAFQTVQRTASTPNLDWLEPAYQRNPAKSSAFQRDVNPYDGLTPLFTFCHTFNKNGFPVGHFPGVLLEQTFDGSS